MAMVKAKAYGHGAVPVSWAALHGGATWLGVCSVGEDIELRRAGIDAPILVVGHTPSRWVRVGIADRLALTISTPEEMQVIEREAQSMGQRGILHLKIDTGMSRLGAMPKEALGLARALDHSKHLEIQGMLRHLAMADMPDAHGIMGWGREYTRRQLEIFQSLVDTLDQEDISIPYRHAANSAAIVTLGEAKFNLVRSGVLLYGLSPSPAVPRPPSFRPALAFKTEIASVKQVPAGTYVGSGCAFQTQRLSRLAVLMVGYADGFRRGLRNYGEVLIGGRRAPIVGRVCMDQTIVDVTDIDEARVGDEVVLLGRQGTTEISAEEVAQKLGTNPHEPVASINARLERRSGT